MHFRMTLIFIVMLASVLCDSFDTNVDNAQYREIISIQNRNFIKSNNQRSTKSFTMKEYPKFLDKTFEELTHKLLGQHPGRINQAFNYGAGHGLVQAPRPTSKGGLTSVFSFSRDRKVNWTEKGMVSPVRDQGFCGSCYAFAALADIQSSFLFKGKKLDLSEQQIIDCSSVFGNEGCNGGWMTSVFAYAMLKGVTAESKYPANNLTLTEGVQGSCLYQRGEFKIRNYAYTSFKTYDCESLTNIVQKRPVTVAIAIDLYFFFYWDGILDNCGFELNHGVQLTGFVETIDTNFWIVKNSWGEWWGMNGYAHINRYNQYGNLCEICYAPSYSIV